MTLILKLFFSSLKWRGVFLTVFSLIANIGILICYCLGAVLYWRYVAIIVQVFLIVQAMGLPFIPESPIWLLGHRGEKEALDALKWLRYFYFKTQKKILLF